LPRLPELLLRLVVVGLTEHRAVRGTLDGTPDPVVATLAEHEGQDTDILRYARDARVQRRVTQQITLLDVDVPLPRTRERFLDDRPPAMMPRHRHRRHGVLPLGVCAGQGVADGGPELHSASSKCPTS